MTTDNSEKKMQPCSNLKSIADKLNILLHHTLIAGQEQLGLPMQISSYSACKYLCSFYFPTQK